MQNVLSVLDRRHDVVGDHDDRDAFFVELADEFIHLVGYEGIKARYRFVEKEHLLSGAKGSCKKDSLLLAARKVAVAPIFEIFDSKALHILMSSFLCSLAIENVSSEAVLASGEDHFID